MTVGDDAFTAAAIRAHAARVQQITVARVASSGRGRGRGNHEQFAGGDEAVRSLELRQSVSDLPPHRGLGIGALPGQHLVQRPE